MFWTKSSLHLELSDAKRVIKEAEDRICSLPLNPQTRGSSYLLNLQLVRLTWVSDAPRITMPETGKSLLFLHFLVLKPTSLPNICPLLIIALLCLFPESLARSLPVAFISVAHLGFQPHVGRKPCLRLLWNFPRPWPANFFHPTQDWQHNPEPIKIRNVALVSDPSPLKSLVQGSSHNA